MNRLEELLEETFAHQAGVPESLEDLSLEGLFDVVATIEKNGLFFELQNKEGYGHFAAFKKNEYQYAAISEFCEFREEAIADVITKLMTNGMF